MPWFYRVTVTVLRVLLCLLTRWQVKGRDNIPDGGPLLVVSNHVNLVDIPLLAVALDRRLMFMAKEELFRFKPLGYFLGSLAAFPVHRGQADRKAFRQAHQILSDGRVLVIFPEGTRSQSGRLRAAFSGAVLIARHSGAPILPVAITGTEKIRGVIWLWRRPRLTVNVGPPFHLPPVNGKLTRTGIAELTTYIMEHIAELLPVEYRGDYARVRGADGAKD